MAAQPRDAEVQPYLNGEPAKPTHRLLTCAAQLIDYRREPGTGVSSAAAFLQENAGRLDILVNNAGISAEPLASSTLGSQTLHADPKSSFYDFKSLSYDASKAALNSFTIHLAHELKDTKIKVNSAHPGWVKTDMGTDAAPMEIPEGAKTGVELALLGDDGPSGGFFHLGKRVPW